VAVVGFDSEPAVVQPFTTDLDAVTQSFDHIETGAGGAAPLDALEMAIAMLAKQPQSYRRVIVLVSETVDRNSKTRLQTALRAVSDSNTIIYSLGYSTTRATTKHEAASMGSNSEAGPPHGCFGKYPDVDLEGNPLPPRENPKAQGSEVGNKAVQYYDCLALLAPPLRLAKAAVFAGLNGLKTNVPEAAARISGGEYFKTENSKALTKDLMKISNRLPNRYFLSFTPSATHPGLHAIGVTLRPERVGVVVEARTSYWQQ
jgi:VWFA-related protein